MSMKEADKEKLIIALAMKDEEDNNQNDYSDIPSKNKKGFARHCFAVAAMFITGLFIMGLEKISDLGFFMPTVLFICVLIIFEQLCVTYCHTYFI